MAISFITFPPSLQLSLIHGSHGLCSSHMQLHVCCLAIPSAPPIAIRCLLFTMFIPTHKVETGHVWICVAVSDALSQWPTLSQAIVFALCVCSWSPLNKKTFPSNKGNSHSLILMTLQQKGNFHNQFLAFHPGFQANSNFNLQPSKRAGKSSSGSPPLGHLLHSCWQCGYLCR